MTPEQAEIVARVKRRLVETPDERFARLLREQLWAFQAELRRQECKSRELSHQELTC